MQRKKLLSQISEIRLIDNTKRPKEYTTFYFTTLYEDQDIELRALKNNLFTFSIYTDVLITRRVPIQPWKNGNCQECTPDKEP